MSTQANDSPASTATTATPWRAHDAGLFRHMMLLSLVIAILVFAIAIVVTPNRVEMAAHALAFLVVNIGLRQASTRVDTRKAARIEALRSLIGTLWLALMCHVAGSDTPIWMLGVIGIISAHILFRDWRAVLVWQILPVVLAPAVLYLDGASVQLAGESALVLFVAAVLIDGFGFRLQSRSDELRATEQTAREFASELRESYEEVLETSWAKSFFLANMSHEIRTPMNAILGVSRLLSDTRLDYERREQVRIIRESAENLLALVSDILDYSMLDAGQIDLVRDGFDLRECVKSAVEYVEAECPNEAIVFTHEIAADVPLAILDDATRVRQILLNLLDNAIKFTESGTITVRVEATAVAESKDEFELAILVRDTGIGIASEDLEHLFDSFVQVDPSSTRVHGGTGLGLAICKRLAKLLDGRLDIESELGVGSCFSVHWRTRAVHDGAQHPASVKQDEVTRYDAQLAKQAPLDILMAEDNVVNQFVATATLESFGYRADIAGDGLEALTSVRRKRYDVVLMDLQMPKLDGLEATRRIRAEIPNDAQPYIIAVTANVTARDRAACFAAGMDGYIPKPYRASELAAALSAAFDHRRARAPGAQQPRT